MRSAHPASPDGASPAAVDPDDFVVDRAVRLRGELALAAACSVVLATVSERSETFSAAISVTAAA
jgi:hypothetical protein